MDGNQSHGCQCSSQSVLTYERKKQVLNGPCEDIVEYRSVCNFLYSEDVLINSCSACQYILTGEPDLPDRIILALGLGSSVDMPLHLVLRLLIPFLEDHQDQLGKGLQQVLKGREVIDSPHSRSKSARM